MNPPRSADTSGAGNQHANLAVASATTRRQFLKTSALVGGSMWLAGLSSAPFGRAAEAPQIAPNHLQGQGPNPANNKLNIAGIGVGGMGANNIKRCAETENVVALCDVDPNYAGKTFKAHPNAKVYADFHEMLEKEKNIDAVVIATPDHTHAVIAMACMRAGKHVYVQKPLAHAVWEARLMTETARQCKVATQMGNQGYSSEGARLVCEWIWSGAIGTVREVHAWTNRPVWPQGIEVGRPTDTPAVPPGMDWDKWIGPAPYRPYHPAYHPGNWRAWCDFGTGSLGDLGCHVLGCVFWSMKLKYPTKVEGCISTYWSDLWKKVEPKNENFPRSAIIRYAFPARGKMPALKLTWWDGGMMPPRPEELEEGRPLGDSDGGVMFIGDKGKLIAGCHGRNPRLIPDAKMRAFRRPPKTLERVPDHERGHEKDWIRACKDGKPACSNFDVSGPLSEMVLMGNLAMRFPNRQLLWDGEKMEVTNDKEANAYVRRQYRKGWTL